MNFTHRQIHQSRLRRRATGSVSLVVLILALLTGCNGGGALDQRLDDYLQRLARSLDQTLLHAEAPADLELPRPRALQIPLKTASLNMLEFVELSQCELHRVIAARNSSLGKLAVPSQDLLQQLDFLKHVDNCLALINDESPELAEKLRRASIDKQQALPTYLWRATLGGTEFRAFWSHDSSDTDYPANADSRTDFALTHLNQITQGILDGNYDVDAVKFHEALAVLRNREGGALQHGWSRAHVAMDSARRLMTERLDRQPLCYPGMVNHQARIFRTVITDYFVKQVQPLLAALNRRYYDIMPRVRQLENRLAGAEPAAYRDYRLQRDAQLDQAHASVVQHIRQAAPLLEQCGFLPSADG
jgi:hypothetical protein